MTISLLPYWESVKDDDITYTPSTYQVGSGKCLCHDIGGAGRQRLVSGTGGPCGTGNSLKYDETHTYIGQLKRTTILQLMGGRSYIRAFPRLPSIYPHPWCYAVCLILIKVTLSITCVQHRTTTACCCSPFPLLPYVRKAPVVGVDVWRCSWWRAGCLQVGSSLGLVVVHHSSGVQGYGRNEGHTRGKTQECHDSRPQWRSGLGALNRFRFVVSWLVRGYFRCSGTGGWEQKKTWGNISPSPVQSEHLSFMVD